MNSATHHVIENIANTAFIQGPNVPNSVLDDLTGIDDPRINQIKHYCEQHGTTLEGAYQIEFTHTIWGILRWRLFAVLLFMMYVLGILTDEAVAWLKSILVE